ncbi:MAG: hypothetical protein ACC651_13710 [Candidatus Scalindua sp.]
MPENKQDKTPKNQRNKFPAPFSMHFTEDERKTLGLLRMIVRSPPLYVFLIFGDENFRSCTRGKSPPKLQIQVPYPSMLM